MTESTIAVKLNGIDNASKAIDGVKNKLDGLNKSVASNGEIAKKATSVASAGMQAFSGSIGGAISGARGMAQAIQGMGVSIGVAVPVAAALAAALYGLKKAYDYVQEASRKQAESLKNQTDEMVKQSRAARDLVGVFDRMSSQRKRMADAVAELYDYSPIRKKEYEGQFMQTDLDTKKSLLDKLSIENTKRQADIAGLEGVAKAKGLSEEVKAQARLSIIELQKEIRENNKVIDSLNDDIKFLSIQVKLNAKKQKELIDAEQKELDQARYDRIKDDAEKWLDMEEKIEKARDSLVSTLTKMAERRDAEIDAMKKSSFARDVSNVSSGAKQVSLTEVARIAALQASGIFKASATGYTTSQGDAFRAEEARRKTEQYQQKMLEMVSQVAKDVGTSEADLNINIMDF